MAFARGDKGVRPLKLGEITHSWGDGARRGDVRQEVQAHLAVQRPWVLSMTEQVLVILKGGRSKKMGEVKKRSAGFGRMLEQTRTDMDV